MPNANHIMWTVWDLTRIHDMWINRYLSDNGERWSTRGWAEKFGMPPDDRWGVGDTPGQVGLFPEVAAEIIAGYRADVLDSAQQVFRGLSEADLEEIAPQILEPCGA